MIEHGAVAARGDNHRGAHLHGLTGLPKSWIVLRGLHPNRARQIRVFRGALKGGAQVVEISALRGVVHDDGRAGWLTTLGSHGRERHIVLVESLIVLVNHLVVLVEAGALRFDELALLIQLATKCFEVRTVLVDLPGELIHARVQA